MRFLIDFDKIKDVVVMPLEDEPLLEKEFTEDSQGNAVTVIREFERTQIVDGPKYEMINKMLDTLLLTEANMTGEDIDKMLEESPFGFRLAFETLEGLGIIKYIEE